MEEFDPNLLKDQNDLSLALRYAREWVIWALCGFGYRTPEEINEIVDTCESCIYYDPEGACGICGCPIARHVGKDNKPAYVSTYCPHPQPRWKSKVKWVNRLFINQK